MEVIGRALYLSSAHSKEGSPIALWVRYLLIEGIHGLHSRSSKGE